MLIPFGEKHYVNSKSMANVSGIGIMVAPSGTAFAQGIGSRKRIAVVLLESAQTQTPRLDPNHPRRGDERFVRKGLEGFSHGATRRGRSA
jgi:hypothetical protein